LGTNNSCILQLLYFFVEKYLLDGLPQGSFFVI
jgi:hypothetical protein